MATGGSDTAPPVAGGSSKPDNKISLEEISFSTADEKYKAKVWEVQRNLHQEDELTDVMLVAEGQSIPCHKVLLSAASQFFYDKFVVHPESLEHNLLDIEGIQFETPKDIVYFMYNGRFEPTLKKVEKLIPASVSLMLPELTNMCKDFLVHKVKHDISACIDVHRIAKSNSLTKIADTARKVMLQNFQTLSKLNAFNEMSETDLQDYISNERLNVANENPVFEAVVSWVRHDVENRKSSFENLMKHVKLSHCSKHFLGEVVRKEPLMETGKCFQHLSDALYQHMTLPRESGIGRIGYYNMLIAVYDDSVYTLKDGESKWATKSSLDQKRLVSSHRMLNFSSACLTESSIVITGGCRHEGGRTKQCWKLTLPTIEWVALPDLKVARCDHATASVGNQVYVLGGATNVIHSVECLCEQNEVWHDTCDMPFEWFGHTAVGYKHFIYVFGGHIPGDWYKAFTGYSLGIAGLDFKLLFRKLNVLTDADTKCKNAFMFDTVNKKWSRKTDMPS